MERKERVELTLAVCVVVAVLVAVLILLTPSAHAATPSPDGTRLPPPPAITSINDGTGVWTICNTNFACYNSKPTNGHATQLYWLGGNLYAKSPTSPFNWWQELSACPPPQCTIANSFKWLNTGTPNDPVVAPPPPLASAEGTIVSGGPVVSITDSNGDVWTLGSTPGDPQRPTLKNGQPFGSGVAIALGYFAGKVYAFTQDEAWLTASGAAWAAADDPQIAHNAGIGMTVTPIQVAPPTPDLSPSKAPQGI